MKGFRLGYIAWLSVSLCFAVSTVENAYAGPMRKIALGNGHSCAITAAGGVQCWGYNQNGQLGNGTNIQSNIPVDVTGLSSGVSPLALGDGHSCALTSQGGVKCWGRNSSGQLGDGTNTASNTPVPVVGLSSGVSALAAGGPHSCAIISGGGVKCWGNNVFGELGIGSCTPGSSIPLDVTGLSSGAAALALGWAHSCALLSGGGVKCWGWNPYGQLGNGTNTDSSIPVSVTGLSGAAAAVAAGDWHSCALTSGGGVKCWGANGGRLGDGTIGNRSTPDFVHGLSSGVSAVALGSNHSCALTRQGGVKCWGMNNSGELGNGTTAGSGIPVDVTGLSSGILAVALGNSHSCALTSWGAVKCWGDNQFGSLGNGSTANSSTPVDIFGAPKAPPTPIPTPFPVWSCTLQADPVCASRPGVARGTHCRFTITVKDRQSKAGIEGAHAALTRKAGKTDWTGIRFGVTDRTGTWVKRVKVSRKASYRSVINQGFCISNIVRVVVR